MLRHFFILLLLCASAFGQITNINFGTTPDDRTGDNLRKAGSKINTNTAWLASQLGASTNASTTLSNLWRVSQSPVAPSLATNWFRIATWGDSLTEGAGASPSSNAYPAVLALLSGYTISNGGVGGQTSTQIKTRMLADTNSHVLPTIIWAGRNNYEDTNAVLTDVAQMVATNNAAGNSNRFVVLGVINGHGGTEDRGTTKYNIITNLNGILSSQYGSHFLDIRAALVNAYNPTNSADVADYTNDVPPDSLRSDAVHLNNAGYIGVANCILTNKMSILRGDWSSFVGAKQLAIQMASPPAIGSGTPNTGTFSTFYADIAYSPLHRVGSPAAYRTISLSGDGTSFQFDGKLIPTVDNNMDIGFDWNFLRWRNAYLSGTVFASNFVAWAASWSPLVHVGNATNYKTFSLSGDFASIQANAKIIPVADNTYDLGNSWNSYRWKDGYFSGTVYSPNFLAWTATYSPLFNVGTTTNYKTFSLSGDFTSVQLNGQFIPAADATYDLGYSDTLFRWRNANLTGTVRSTANIVTNSANTGRVMADSDYRGYKLLNNGGAGYAGGSAIDLFSIGGTPRMMSGILTIRTTWAGGNGIYTYVFGIVGSGTTTTISPTSFQEYGTGPTGTLTLQKDVPTSGSDGVRFTLGGTAITTLEFVWKPLWVDGGSTITGF